MQVLRRRSPVHATVAAMASLTWTPRREGLLERAAKPLILALALCLVLADRWGLPGRRARPAAARGPRLLERAANALVLLLALCVALAGSLPLRRRRVARRRRAPGPAALRLLAARLVHTAHATRDTCAGRAAALPILLYGAMLLPAAQVLQPCRAAALRFARRGRVTAVALAGPPGAVLWWSGLAAREGAQALAVALGSAAAGPARWGWPSRLALAALAAATSLVAPTHLAPDARLAVPDHPWPAIRLPVPFAWPALAPAPPQRLPAGGDSAPAVASAVAPAPDPATAAAPAAPVVVDRGPWQPPDAPRRPFVAQVEAWRPLVRELLAEAWGEGRLDGPAAALDDDLVLAVIQQESGGNPDAVSWAGAIGLMQVMPFTFAEMMHGDRALVDAIDPAAMWDVPSNARAGIRYLALAMQAFEGNLYWSLAAYNAGIEAVGKWRAAGLYAVPPIGGYWETAAYAPAILRAYLRHRPGLEVYVPDAMPREHVPGAIRLLQEAGLWEGQ